MSTQRVAGIEVAQIRALAELLARVEDDARVDLALDDAGTLLVTVDQADEDRTRTHWAIDDCANTMPAIGPAAGAPE